MCLLAESKPQTPIRWRVDQISYGKELSDQERLKTIYSNVHLIQCTCSLIQCSWLLLVHETEIPLWLQLLTNTSNAYCNKMDVYWNNIDKLTFSVSAVLQSSMNSHNKWKNDILNYYIASAISSDLLWHIYIRSM